MSSTNCPNCGAVRTGNLCEYCGTSFLDLTEIEIGKKLMLKIKDSIVCCSVVVSQCEVELTYQDPIYFMDGLQVWCENRKPKQIIRLEFHEI